MNRRVREPLATVPEVAAYLGVAPQTLYNWRAANRGPRSTRVGGRLRYRWADVETFAASGARGAA